jgi:hypothetical protein
MRSRSALADGGQRLAGGPPRIRGRAGRERQQDPQAVRDGGRGLRRAAVRGGDLGRDGQPEAGAPGPLASGRRRRKMAAACPADAQGRRRSPRWRRGPAADAASVPAVRAGVCTSVHQQVVDGAANGFASPTIPRPLLTGPARSARGRVAPAPRTRRPGGHVDGSEDRPGCWPNRASRSMASTSRPIPGLQRDRPSPRRLVRAAQRACWCGSALAPARPAACAARGSVGEEPAHLLLAGFALVQPVSIRVSMPFSAAPSLPTRCAGGAGSPGGQVATVIRSAGKPASPHQTHKTTANTAENECRDDDPSDERRAGR